MKIEERAKLEADLQATIDLVTAMFWNLECGENLSHEQVAACQYDRVLGVLWWRIWDYAEYKSRTHRLCRAARDDDTSIYLENNTQQIHNTIRQGERVTQIVNEIRAIALRGHPKARAMRRRFMAKSNAARKTIPASNAIMAPIEQAA